MLIEAKGDTMTKNNDSLMVYKAIAVAGVLFYLYKVSKANGGTLQGNPMGVKINPDRLIHLGSHLLPEQHRQKALELGFAVLDTYTKAKLKAAAQSARQRS